MRDTPRRLRRATAALATLLALAACADPGISPAGPVRAAPADLAAPCLTSSLKATVTLQPAATDSTVRVALVALTNTATEPCTLNGWLTISLVNTAEDVVPVPTTKLDQPRQPSTFQVEAGGSAYTGLKWISCEKTAPKCAVGANLRYSLGLKPEGPVAALKDFPPPRRSRLAMTELRIGVLTPAPEQALTW